MRRLLLIVFFAAILIYPIFHLMAAPTKADNSEMNQKIEYSSELTADQQSSSTKDVEITRALRQELMKDGNLSTYAHNVKIITQNGVVTLKGPVRSQAEKSLIAKRARNIPGCKHVANEIDVTSKI